MVRTGCDILSSGARESLRGRRTGLLANPASVSRELEHVSSVLLRRGADLGCLFGPQHGWWGETQANMIEWEGFTHPTLGIPVHSLYGSSREPDPGTLQGLELVVIDLPDIGARTYTYLWTALLMMRACAAAGIEVLLLDRPNPIGGAAVEGPLLDERYHSFVGLYTLPLRHGMTMGEILAMVNETEGTGSELIVVRAEGWKRSMLHDETGLPWVLPSPNMPSSETALLYPGTVLLEGTNISEGRGTTKPFEVVGAPWIDPFTFARALEEHGPGGAYFRPLVFVPAWDRYAGEACGGVQVHVTDRRNFRPVRCGALLLATAAAIYPEQFRWLNPPYEYEKNLPPIDILSGSPELREAVDTRKDISQLFGIWERDEKRFEKERKPFLMY